MAILVQLARERAVEDEKLSEQAKAEFGNEFASHFSYFKDGQHKVLLKTSSIAKQYCRLKGIEDEV